MASSMDPAPGSTPMAMLTLTGQGPLSVQHFVRKNVATFTGSARAA